MGGFPSAYSPRSNLRPPPPPPQPSPSTSILEENGVERPVVRRAIESGAEKRAMANGGESLEMEDGDETLRGVASELVMCSTCSGFVMRKERTAVRHPDEEAVEVVTEAEKMRDLMQAVQRYGPFQEKEPDEATKEQWLVLRRRRMIMMETKRCPACSRSLLEMCPTCSCSLSEKPTGPDEEDKAAESKEEEKSWNEVGIELMAATEDEAMVADAGSVRNSKRSRDEDNGSGSGLKMKKAKSEDKKDSGSEKKARSSEIEDSTSNKVKMVGSEPVGGNGKTKMGGNGKTKMVTMRLDKKSLDILKALPPVKPLTVATNHSLILSKFARSNAKYEVDCEFHEYLRRQSIIRGYAEYQLEVSDDEENGHKLV